MINVRFFCVGVESIDIIFVIVVMCVFINVWIKKYMKLNVEGNW